MQVIEKPQNYVQQRQQRRALKAKRKKTNEIEPIDRRCALRVKLKSLAAEAKIIRKEEKHTRSLSQFMFLREHRIGMVRQEARHTLLALAYIKGMEYKQIETPSPLKRLKVVNIKRIASMVFAYGNKGMKLADLEVSIAHWAFKK